MATPEELKEWLRPIEDPEMRMSLVDLGLIYELSISEDLVIACTMTLTTPSCPAADYIVKQVQDRLKEYPGVKDATVKLVFEPKWNAREMASEEAKEKLRIW